MDRPGQQLFEQFARIGRALGSPKRLELLYLIAQGERTVEALADAASLPVTTASANLQILKQAQLVSTRREGVRVHYSLAGDDVGELFLLLRRVAGAHLAEVEPAWLALIGMDRATANELEAPDREREELVERVRAGSTVLLDVRPGVEYDAGHLPGAVSMPVEELPRRLDEVPVDTEVIAYCRGEYCVMAYEAVALLRRHGRRAFLLEDGPLEWRVAGLPVPRAGAESAPPD